MVSRAGLFVEMHRLRIELGREGDDLLARDQPRAVFGEHPGLEVFEMDFGHRHQIPTTTGMFPVVFGSVNNFGA